MFHTLIFVGNVGRDPEMRYTPAGQAVTSFSVACNRQYTTNNGETIKETIWFRVSAWGKQAEICNQYLKKGSKVLVEGRLTPDKETGGPRIWNGQDGSARLRNVLIPIADDPDASGAVAAALRLADLLDQDACFHLLHIGPPDAMPPHSLEGRLGNEIGRQGPLVDTIVEVADEVRADLIVMATAGHKGFLDALMGSTTEGVLRKARRALLAVPAV